MKVLFVAEQFVPPVFNGSTLVYDLWLRMLHRFEDAYAILFKAEGEPTAETHAELGKLCRDYLILPGHARSRFMKSARALARLANGSLFAPAPVEEFGRSPFQREISDFLARVRPDVMVLSKLNSVNLLGERIVRDFPGPRILDLHDDFVTREHLERSKLADMLAAYPALADYPAYRMTRLRQRMSRFDLERARRQESRLLGMFDRVLVSSREEYRDYSAKPDIGSACVHAPWPLGGEDSARQRTAAPEFEAGFIGSDAPFNLEALLFFTQKVLPQIRRKRPDFRLLVTGGVTIPYARLGSPADGVVLEKSVKDVGSFYDRIAVGVVPLLSGTGISLKTLEALRFGRPVVAMLAGARGLAGRTLPGLHVVDDAGAFAECLLDVLNQKTHPGPADGGGADALVEYHRVLRRVCTELGVPDASGNARSGTGTTGPIQLTEPSWAAR